MGAETQTPGQTAERDAFINRMVSAFLGTLDVGTIYLGERLGLYRSLAENGPLTSRELANRQHLHERYVREWLEQQAVSGILAVEAADGQPEDRRYAIPPAHVEVLLDVDSLNYLGPYPSQLLSVLRPIEQLIDAFRTGDGVPYEAYGRDCRDGIATGNRVQFVNLLGSTWFPAIPELDERLRDRHGARVADVGCGVGWSSISIARAYPRVRIDAFDLDPASIEAARRNAEAARLDHRIVFHLEDAAKISASERYDLVVAFETIHDMARPVEALRAMRALAKPDGFVLVVDENVGESFQPDAGDIERLYYGFSVLHCLPAGMASQPSAATGTVMRPATLTAYAKEAGFKKVETLPISHDYWRFYRLTG